MQERLDIIRQQPATWADWEPLRGGLQSHQALRQRYTQAPLWQVLHQAQEADIVRHRTHAAWWQPARWTGAVIQQGPPPDGAVQMVWANMLLHTQAQPQAMLAQWHRALSVDGFLMFSCLGPDSLRELRQVHERMGWSLPAHDFTDMHDWGDMLVQAGFAEPVMDMERITLTFADAGRLLQELRELGRNLRVDRPVGLRGRAWKAAWLQAVETLGERDGEGRLRLSFEVVYGHAMKPAARARVLPESRVDLADMRQMLRRS
jgi:malonyl-CoA O-methyltransferase